LVFSGYGVVFGDGVSFVLFFSGLDGFFFLLMAEVFFHFSGDLTGFSNAVEGL